MRKVILEALLITRLFTNDGVFLESRRIPVKKQSTDLMVAIRRPWKRGKKKF